MKIHRSLVYASDANLQSFRANAIHVMKICSSFATLCDTVTLFCVHKGRDEGVYDKYGVDRRFYINAAFSQECQWMPAFIKCILSGIRNATRINRTYKEAFVYGRSLWTLMFLRKNRDFSYEVHSVPTKRIYNFFESIILHRSSLKKLVTISDPLKQEYLKRYPNLIGKIQVLHDGADSVSKGTEKAVLIKKGECDVHIGYVGSLYPGKCMETLIPIASKMSDVFFHIVGGPGVLVDSWKERCRKENVDNILFYGNVMPNKVNSYYQAFDIVILPYSNNIFYREGKSDDIGKWISPLKLFEAMSNGKAILVTSLDSINEILDHGKDAFIIEANDVNGWVYMLRTLIADSALREKLGKKALDKFEAHYTWKKRAEQILE